jgi:hypothetical protein
MGAPPVAERELTATFPPIFRSERTLGAAVEWTLA